MNSELEKESKGDLVVEAAENAEILEVNKNHYVDNGKVNLNSIDNDTSLNHQEPLKNCFFESLHVNEIKQNLFGEEISSKIEEEPNALEVCDRKSENGEIHNIAYFEGDQMIGDLKYDSNRNANFVKKKRKKILCALADDDIDFLKEAAISPGGLLCDDIRRKVWPKLLGVDVIETSPRPSREDIEKHHYYHQVVLDVNRSLKRFPPSIKEAQRLAMLDQLVLLIMRVLCKHPELHYYQGYHDICVTFLLVLGEEMAYYVVEKLSKTHLEVFMKESMEHTIDMLNCMYPLIEKKSSQLSKFLLKSEVGVAYCISWLITWFGHVLNDYDTVVRLFDFFIVSDPAMPLYLTTAVVLHRKTEVLQQDCDMASVHALLSRIPDDLPFENLLLESLDLFDKFSYAKLKRESSYLNDGRSKVRRNYNLMKYFARKIKSSVPASNFTVPLVIAAAVLVTAILYQAYKY